MTEPATTVLSVRGDAQLEVPPDYVTLGCGVGADEPDKAAALQSVSARLEAVLNDLRDLGAQPRTAADDRRPLTFLARSATSRAETRWDRQRDHEVKTGRVLARVWLRIEVRDFAMLDQLGSALARHEAIDIENVRWGADPDNPGWSNVRSAAIGAAIEKGRDYALALGGALQRFEHVADAGLLGGDDSDRYHGYAVVQSASGGRPPDSPSLDPEPQMLHAAIEARFIASVRPLA